MAIYPTWLTTGSVNGNIPIVVDIGTNGVCGGYSGGVRVTMNAGYTYVMAAPASYPTPPFLDGSATVFQAGLSFGPGSVLVLLKPEALALVAASAATLGDYL